MTNKKSLRTKETCLVISNYKVCWDSNSKLAFISSNIPDYLDAEWLKTIDHVVLDGPWESQEYRRKGREFVVERVDCYRKELFSILNSAMGLEYSEKTWGILLDPWLLMFLSVIYDRLNKLENAKEQLGNIFIKCPGDHPVSISTSVNFSNCCTKEYGNQQLYCDIALAIGVDVKPCSDFPQENNAFEGPEEKVLKKNVHSFALKPLRFLVRWWIKYRKPLVVTNGYFSIRAQILILLRSLGKVLLIPSRMLFDELSDFKKNEALRNFLKVAEHDKYDLVANRLIKKYFPISLLEGLKPYCEKVSSLSVIPLLGSANDFYYNDEYKILASQVKEKGNKIIGFQHGGNYSFEKSGLCVAEYFEKLNADKYYRWKEKSLCGKFLPSQKLEWVYSLTKARRRRSGNLDILFVSVGIRKFTHREHAGNPDFFLKYIAEQQKFYFGLDEKISKHFLLRPYMQDFGWRYKERWLDVTEGKIRFDPNPQFYKSLISCGIYVSDHISTTWLEAFCADVPVILFFDRDQYFATDEVKSLFEELQAVGIYHASVESAVSFLNEKYESIEKWWEMPETKSASDKVKNYFFTTSNNFTKEWTQELVALRDKTLKDKLN